MNAFAQRQLPNDLLNPEIVEKLRWAFNTYLRLSLNKKLASLWARLSSNRLVTKNPALRQFQGIPKTSQLPPCTCAQFLQQSDVPKIAKLTRNYFFGKLNKIFNFCHVRSVDEIVRDRFQGLEIFGSIVAAEFQVGFSVGVVNRWKDVGVKRLVEVGHHRRHGAVKCQSLDPWEAMDMFNFATLHLVPKPSIRIVLCKELLGDTVLQI